MTTDQLIQEARKTLAEMKAAETTGNRFAKSLDEYLSDHTAADLSGMIDVSQQFLSDVRHGRRNVSRALVELIAELHTKRSNGR